MKLAELHSEVQHDILRYFSTHPGIEENAYGIHSNWFINEHISPSINEVQTALERLFESGDLKRRVNSDIYTK
jgi:hypothetical protein